MDGKSKANFINSVAGGQKRPCPNCNTLNEQDARFCISCGMKLNGPETAEIPGEEAPKLFCPNCGTKNERDSRFCTSCGAEIGQELEDSGGNGTSQSSPVPFQKVSDAGKKPAFGKVMLEVPACEEEESVFAKGLPDWDIVPPQVMVRRKEK